MRAVRKLPFCYLCGRDFAASDTINDDHVPPSSMFHKEDRSVPLILPTHKVCNDREHESDELRGLFIAQIEGWPIPPAHRYEKAQVQIVEGRLVTMTRVFNIRRFIVRCVRAFHAALYRQWLPSETRNAIHPPLHGGEFDAATGLPANRIEAASLGDAMLNQAALLVAAIKKNRFAGCTDKVVCRNEKCIYECVWVRTSDGRDACVFGLKIYNWHRFGELAGYTPRGCVGII